MLRISKLTDYGTVVMTYLARNPNGIHAANEIADEVAVALPTTSKLLKLLARAELENFLDAGGNRLGDHVEISERDFARRFLRRRILFGCVDQ